MSAFKNVDCRIDVKSETEISLNNNSDFRISHSKKFAIPKILKTKYDDLFKFIN